MNQIGLFVLNSILLGVGLAMDAFSVSLANGLQEPNMRMKKQVCIAGAFATFQFLMPMLGWLCVHTVVKLFSRFQTVIPWIALVLLVFIGGKMLIEGIRHRGEAGQNVRLTPAVLLVQSVATSIDALSVGFTIAEYGLLSALCCALIIAAVTFLLCTVGIRLGRRFGTKMSGGANILGGLILIGIGIEIFLSGV